jgi:hypothetical protein
MGMED